MEKSIKRIIMAGEIAANWINKRTKQEHRMRVYSGTFDNLANLLRSFRDGKMAVSGISRIPDLGIIEKMEYIDVWSSDRDGMVRLAAWLDKRNIENTGVW